MLPAMLGLAAGLVLGSGPAMALLVPLVLAFVLMITAWTYCLRGWLAALMVNKRRRRAVIVGVTSVLLVQSLLQLPNLLTNLWLRGEMPEMPPPINQIDTPRISRILMPGRGGIAALAGSVAPPSSGGLSPSSTWSTATCRC